MRLCTKFVMRRCVQFGQCVRICLALTTPFAVRSGAIRTRNVPRVQIDIQTYAFGPDVSRKGAFGFLKAITHLYCLIEQMGPLCWCCINVCNVFLVVFPSKVPLTFVILCYCDAFVGISVEGPNRLRLGCIFAPSRIETFRSTAFLMIEERGIEWLVPIRRARMSSHARRVFCVLPSTRLRNVAWSCSLFT